MYRQNVRRLFEQYDLADLHELLPRKREMYKRPEYSCI